MPIVRLACGHCGLQATCVKTGLGGVTSVDPYLFAEMCPVAAAAVLRGDHPSALACPHLAALGFADIADNDEAHPAPARKAG